MKNKMPKVKEYLLVTHSCHFSEHKKHDCFGKTKQTDLDGLVVIIRDLLPKWPVTPREGFARERG